MSTTAETPASDDDVTPSDAARGDTARSDVTQNDCWDEPSAKMRADARRSRVKLLEAATAAFAEHGADAPLEDIARRAGVGIGTLYRHFPTRTDLQAAVFRSQVIAVCGEGDALLKKASPEQ